MNILTLALVTKMYQLRVMDIRQNHKYKTLPKSLSRSWERLLVLNVWLSLVSNGRSHYLLA